MADWKNVTWEDDEYITTDKLNDMVARDDWLKERVLPVSYRAGGLTKNSGLRMICGVTNMTGSSDPRGNWVTVEFRNGGFTSGCRPVVVCSIGAGDVYATMVTMQGIAGNGVKDIDHRGFRCRVVSGNVEDTSFKTARWVHWIAVGY